jgi:hypothetical protein
MPHKTLMASVGLSKALDWVYLSALQAVGKETGLNDGGRLEE